MFDLLVTFRVHLACFVLGGVVFRWGPDLVADFFTPTFAGASADAPAPPAELERALREMRRTGM